MNTLKSIIWFIRKHLDPVVNDIWSTKPHINMKEWKVNSNGTITKI